MQCSAVQCSAVQCSAVQCSAVQCSAGQGSGVLCKTVQKQCIEVQMTGLYSAVDLSVLQDWSGPPAVWLLPPWGPLWGEAGEWQLQALYLPPEVTYGSVIVTTGQIQLYTCHHRSHLALYLSPQVTLGSVLVIIGHTQLCTCHHRGQTTL